ncbi:hypothetical protein J4427_01260 [Candidatus Woesearchaeota archaeon]|nr:hypothetical protein [Candidatus Woesearchaeota archaeon]
MNKKGDFAWETLMKLFIALLVLVFILTIIYFAKEKIMSILEKFASLLRFGG